MSRSNTDARSEARPDWNPIAPTIAVASTLIVSSISSSLDWMLTRSSRLRLDLLRVSVAPSDQSPQQGRRISQPCGGTTVWPSTSGGGAPEPASTSACLPINAAIGNSIAASSTLSATIRASSPCRV